MRKLARRLAKEEPFDLVHACSPPDFMLLAALSLRRQGARFVFDHHDLTPELYATRFGEGLIQRATLAAEQVQLHALATWWDVLCVAERLGYFGPGQFAAVKSFLDNPDGWSPTTPSAA